MLRVIRRIHMYLALGLMAWMVVYAVSTIAMNHRAFFRRVDPIPISPTVIDRVHPLAGPADADARTKARRLLADLGLDGPYYLDDRRAKTGEIVIYRERPGRETKITYTEADQRLLVQQQAFRLRPWFNALHIRNGFGTPYPAATAWAVLVDVVCAAMIWWALSGVYMWWKGAGARRWGALSLTAGGLICGALVAAL